MTDEEGIDWEIPAVTVVILNNLPADRIEDAKAYVKRHLLSKIPAAQLARVLRSGDAILIEPMLGDRLDHAAAAKLLETTKQGGNERSEWVQLLVQVARNEQSGRLVVRCECEHVIDHHVISWGESSEGPLVRSPFVYCEDCMEECG